jgi:hypothetical protein
MRRVIPFVVLAASFLLPLCRAENAGCDLHKELALLVEEAA